MGPESAAMLGEGTGKVGGWFLLKGALHADITLLRAHWTVKKASRSKSNEAPGGRNETQ